RPQPGRLGPDRRSQGAAQYTDVLRGRPARHALDPTHAAQIQLSADRATAPRHGCRAFRRRTDRSRCRLLPAEAEDLADSVDVEIDVLPTVIEAQDALRPDAPRVHDGLASNVVVESRFATADFDAAMEGADRHIGVTLRS